MDKYEVVITIMSAVVILTGFGMLIDGVTKHDNIHLGLGPLVMFLGSFLIFVRWAFRIEKHDYEVKI